MIELQKRAQRQWAATPLRKRLTVLGKARSLIAANPSRFLKPDFENLSSEVLPLLACIRFLESSAEKILKTRQLGRNGRPFWLTGTHTEVQRVPFGLVLVIGPSNYPLYLPGLQTAQALAAGNAVVWKPGAGGRAVADAFADICAEAGLPSGVLTVTGESVSDAQHAIEAGVDKVFLTGSAASGRGLLHQLADKLVPAVVELSGCDAVIVLPGADLKRVVSAVTFGIGLNGSCTCMAPRRLLLVGATPQQKDQLVQELIAGFSQVKPAVLSAAGFTRLGALLDDARLHGASVHGELREQGVRPVLVTDAQPTLALAQEDIFAPVLTMIELGNPKDVIAAQAACPFGLTASVFGPESACRTLAEHLEVGTVFINDVIFPSADPRSPFGGRRLSGFGVTQGVEGLLEMAAVKTISVQRARAPMHYDPPKQNQPGLFVPLIQLIYREGFRNRLQAFLSMMREGRRLRRQASGREA